MDENMIIAQSVEPSGRVARENWLWLHKQTKPWTSWPTLA